MGVAPIITVALCIQRIKNILKVYEMHFFYHERAGDKFVTPC